MLSVLAAGLLLLATPLHAQEPPDAAFRDGGITQNTGILVLDYDRLFGLTRFGRKATQEMRDATAIITENNHRISSELVRLETMMMGLKATMEPDLFQEQRDQFNRLANCMRDQRQATAQRSEHWLESRQQIFRADFVGLFTNNSQFQFDLLLDRDHVLVYKTELDVTVAVAEFVDVVLGDGTGSDQYVSALEAIEEISLTSFDLVRSSIEPCIARIGGLRVWGDTEN